MYIEIPTVNPKYMNHQLNSNGKSITVTFEFLNNTDCNDMVRFLTEVIDEMTSNEGE